VVATKIIPESALTAAKNQFQAGLSALFDDVLDPQWHQSTLKPMAAELALAGISKFDCLASVDQGRRFDKKVESCFTLCGDTVRTLWDVASPHKRKAINDFHKLVITTWPIKILEFIPEKLRSLFSRPSFMKYFEEHIKETSEAKRTMILQLTSATAIKQRSISAKFDRQARQSAVKKFKLRHKATTRGAATLLGTTYESLRNFCKGRGLDSAPSVALIWKELKANEKF
jgi:hypothetical protein